MRAEFAEAVVLLANHGKALAHNHSIDKIGTEILRVAPKVSSAANRAVSQLRQLAD
jgi:hypothetical protein